MASAWGVALGSWDATRRTVAPMESKHYMLLGQEVSDAVGNYVLAKFYPDMAEIDCAVQFVLVRGKIGAEVEVMRARATKKRESAGKRKL